MKNWFYIIAFNTFGILFSCAQKEEQKEPHLVQHHMNKINDFVPEYLAKIPDLTLSSSGYNKAIINNYSIEGTIDTIGLKQGYWNISDTKNNFRFQGAYTNNLPSGWWEVFYHNELIACGHYQMGKKQGHWSYLRIGKTNMRCVTYSNDTLVGWGKELTMDSILLTEGSFNKGLKDGDWKYYHQNGKIKEHGAFLENEKSGWWQCFDESGQLLEEANYEQGKRSGYVKRYLGGIIAEEGKLINESKKGTWRYYDNVGQLKRIHEYEE